MRALGVGPWTAGDLVETRSAQVPMVVGEEGGDSDETTRKGAPGVVKEAIAVLDKVVEGGGI